MNCHTNMSLFSIYIIFLFVFIQSRFAVSSYTNCTRFQDTLDCSGVKFHGDLNIDPKFSWTVRQLILKDNFIKEILHQRVWHFFPKLQVLEIVNNQLSYLDRNTFDGLIDLNKLSMANNELTMFPSQQIASLKKLKTLNVARNNFFGPLHISTFSHAVFPNLEHIDLSDNRYASIVGSPFINMRNLKTLNLSSTKVTSIKKENFKGLQNLQTLLLNHLTLFNNLHEDVFQYTTKLQYLEIHESKLLNISLDTVKKLPLMQIRLGMNPLICGCSTQWIWNELHHKSSEWNHEVFVRDESDLPLHCMNLNTRKYHDLVTMKTGFCEKELFTWSLWSKCNIHCEQRRHQKCEQHGTGFCKDEKTEEQRKCSQEECEDYQTLQISSLLDDGEWSSWSSWSKCTAQCNGITNRQRHCTNPPPPMKGGVCTGESAESKHCSVGPCLDIARLSGETPTHQHSTYKWIEEIIKKESTRRTDDIILAVVIVIVVLVFITCVGVFMLLLKQRRRKKKRHDIPVLDYIKQSQSVRDKVAASTRRFLENKNWFSGNSSNKDIPPMPFLKKKINGKEKGFFLASGEYVKRRNQEDLPPIPTTMTLATQNIYESPEWYQKFSGEDGLEENCNELTDDLYTNIPSSKKKVQFSKDTRTQELDEDLYLLPTDIQINK